ncbi:VOC family protein [Solirubrobacter phytolaccae]|uniref:VOC family protein n=1 Tax=Solirubrobacter phytolaccae TaxID=1404360 RepID=A0A9X3NEV3_9ACTN|nr:VOC family protein [Solirubrobacter phytolaccae]MDA0184756.1 VOC family protein [Solirubrobacter phytolaccae]
MELQGLHHITMITGDAQKNVDFYADTLGLRLVKKTVNFDSPDAYHLYFGDEQGSPGTILTWFEFAGARRGRAGAGQIHTIQLGVASGEALGFWAERLGVERDGDVVAFEDYDGLRYQLVISDAEPKRAVHPEVPEAFAITGIVGARAYGESGPHRVLTDVLGFAADGDDFTLGGFRWGYDAPPAERRLLGAGTVHHIAWASKDEDHLAWRARVEEAGLGVSDVRDRDYFQSIYFGEPRGILFEIATLSPGFAVDEDPEHLGEALRLPKQHEHLRPQLERLLTPVTNPRSTKELA